MPYRLEYAKSNRGGCNVAACKHADAKIDKGQLKFGIWIDPKSETLSPFFSWKHWGCVTAANLADINNEIDGDHAMLDGFEDLSEADQDRVAQALVKGEIAAEDKTAFTEQENHNYEQYLADEERLKEMRQEAKDNNKGFNLKAERKKLEDARNTARKAAAQEAKVASKAAAKAEKEAQKAAEKAQKEAQKAEKAQKEAQKAEKAKKPTANVSKKRKQVKDEDEDEDEQDEDDDEPAPKKQNRSKATSKAKETKSTSAVRQSARAKKAIKAESDEEEQDSPDEAVPKAKTTRKKKAVKAESDDEGPAPKVKAAKKASRSKA